MASHNPDFSSYSDKQLQIASQSIDAVTFKADAIRLAQEMADRGMDWPLSNPLPEPEPSTIERMETIAIALLHSSVVHIGFLIALAIVFICDMAWQYPLQRLEQAQKYIAQPTKVECYERFYWEDLTPSFEYDLEVNVDQYLYFVIGNDKNACLEFEQNLQNTGEMILWHDEFAIYQLADQNGIVIPFEQQQRRMTDAWLERIGFHALWWVFFAVVGFFFSGRRSSKAG